MLKLDFITKCNIYTALWCIYNLQGSILEQDALIGKFIFVIIMLVSFNHIGRLVSSKEEFPAFVKVLFWYLAISTVYGIIRFFEGTFINNSGVEIDNIHYYKSILVATIPFFSFYYYSKKGYISRKWFTNWLLVFTGVALCQYYSITVRLLSVAFEAGSSQTEFTNNAGYYFLAMIPVLMLSQFNKTIKMVYLLGITLLIFMAMKRGAILIFLLSLMWYAACQLKNLPTKKKILLFVTSFVFLIFVYEIVISFAESDDFFALRLEQTIAGETSGRDSIYMTLVNYMFERATLVEWLVGKGFDGTVKVADIGAHNDWLEFWVEMGLLGVALNIVYWSCYYKDWKELRRDRVLYFALGMLFVSGFLKTFFSIHIINVYFYENCVMAYCISQVVADNNGESREKNINLR